MRSPYFFAFLGRTLGAESAQPGNLEGSTGRGALRWRAVQVHNLWGWCSRVP